VEERTEMITDRMKYTDVKYFYPDVFLSEEDQMLQTTLRDFVNKEIMPVRDKIDDDKEHLLIDKIRQGIWDIGLQKLFFPKEYGGEGKPSLLSFLIAQEELARGDSGITTTIACTMWAWLPAIIGYGMGDAHAKAILDRFAPDFMGKELRTACFEMTEPGGPEGGGGNDIEDIVHLGQKFATRAKLDGDEWVINGTKMWATNSGIADLYCVACTVDPKLGREGIVIAYVPAPREGLSHSPFEVKAGLQADRNCATYFDDVRIPKEWAIGPGGMAAELFKVQASAGAADAAHAAGMLQGAFEEVLKFTGQRVSGGKLINQHSIVAGILADIVTGIQTARIHYLTIGYMLDHPEIYGPSTSDIMISRSKMVKVLGAEIVNKCLPLCMQLMGSYGYVRENHVEKYWRDAAELQLWLGGTQTARYAVCRGYYDLDL
jgi:butyryl-CoA dehydrogenase